MNDVIVRLRRERDALDRRLSRIDAAIEEYERWARSVAELVGGDAAPPVGTPPVDASGEQTPIAVFEEKVRTLLGGVPAPLKRTEVHDALRQAGVVVGGKDPLNTVAARLSRMSGITNIKGHGYWAEERPYPPAGHDVASASAGALFDGDDTARAETGTPAEGGDAPTDEAE